MALAHLEKTNSCCSNGPTMNVIANWQFCQFEPFMKIDDISLQSPTCSGFVSISYRLVDTTRVFLQTNLSTQSHGLQRSGLKRWFFCLVCLVLCVCVLVVF